MSMRVDVGAVVKLNPEIFGKEASFKNDGMYGDLGYVGLFKDIIWRITRVEEDGYRGKIAYAAVMNAEQIKAKAEGEAVLLLKDLVPAVVKCTLEYQIIDNKLSNQKKVEQLLDDRKKLKDMGLPASNPMMKENWALICELRENMKDEGKPSKVVSVLLPKQRVSFDILRKDLPNDTEESQDKFRMMLSYQLRNFRREAKEKQIKRVAKKSKQGSYTSWLEGGVHLSPGEHNKAYEDGLRTILDKDKLPSQKEATYFGIEMEFIFDGNEKKLREELIKARLHKNVQLVTDGSVYPCRNQGGYQGRELRVLATRDEVKSVLDRLDFVLAKVDAYVNRSCGTHVHLDMRNRNAAAVFRNLVRVQPILRGSQPIGRINNKFCGENTSENIKEMTHRGDGGRYAVINGHAFETHQTIEIRVHEGTTDCESIYNWVMFLDSIASHKEEIPKNKFKKASELVSIIPSIPKASIEYVDRRIDKFRSLEAV